MFQFYTILLLTLCLTYSISTDTNEFLLRSIYNSNENRRIPPADENTDESDKNNNTNDFFSKKNGDYILLKKSHEKLFNERLKIIIIISSISVGIMAIIVITCITTQYFRNKKLERPERAEQSVPLNTSMQTKNRSKTNYDTRKTKTSRTTTPSVV